MEIFDSDLEETSGDSEASDCSEWRPPRSWRSSQEEFYEEDIIVKEETDDEDNPSVDWTLPGMGDAHFDQIEAMLHKYIDNLDEAINDTSYLLDRSRRVLGRPSQNASTSTIAKPTTMKVTAEGNWINPIHL